MPFRVFTFLHYCDAVRFNYIELDPGLSELNVSFPSSIIPFMFAQDFANVAYAASMIRIARKHSAVVTQHLLYHKLQNSSVTPKIDALLCCFEAKLMHLAEDRNQEYCAV